MMDQLLTVMLPWSSPYGTMLKIIRSKLDSGTVHSTLNVIVLLSQVFSVL